MPVNSRRRGVTAVSAAVGATAAVGLVWFTRPQPQAPGGTLLDNGLRSPMPVIVIGPQPWVYLLAAIVGALIGTGIVMAAFHIAGRPTADRA